jgi:hypothetical protein
VNVRVGFLSGSPKMPERANQFSVEAVLRHEGSRVRLAHEHGVARVLDRAHAIDDDVLECHKRSARFRQRKSAYPSTRFEEDLHARCAERGVGNDERAIRSGVKRAGIQNAAGFDAYADDFFRLSFKRRRNPEHGVRPAVEEKIVPVRRGLAGRELFEPAGNVRRQRGH